MSAPRYRIKRVEVTERPVTMRLPFRFGDTVVHETAEAYLRVTVEGGRGVATGTSAQLMVPRWFDKRPALSNADTVDELRQTVEAAAKAAIDLEGSVAEIASSLRWLAREKLPADTPRLAAGFGPALVEMALIDAACRDAEVSFYQAARGDLFGLADQCPDDLDPAILTGFLDRIAPPATMAMRHTVGYDAPLVAGEVSDRPDELPVALAEVIAATGVSHFKIKLKGDPEPDIARLRSIAEVLAELSGYVATLDANEQYNADAFGEFIDRWQADSGLETLRSNTLFVEQPYPREIALAGDGLRFPADVPLVIDESDDNERSFPRALELGWSGVSVKSCKGVLRALMNGVRVAALRQSGQRAILTAEDLTCQPGRCWQQDTMMAAAVGATHMERNGHHFAGGMQGASEAERQAFLDAHPDVYAGTAANPVLRIEHGRVAIGSLDAPGFGSVPDPDFSTNPITAYE